MKFTFKYTLKCVILASMQYSLMQKIYTNFGLPDLLYMQSRQTSIMSKNLGQIAAILNSKKTVTRGVGR